MQVVVKIFRIRRYTGFMDGPNYYHHADVIAPSWQAALKAARERRVRNWRWIDTYDTNDKDYCRFEYLYMVDKADAKNPCEPVSST